MKYILNLYYFTKHSSELAIFFFFLITSLFLGDGKQSFVDVWWAMGILTMYGVRYYQRGKLDLRPLPRLIGWAWVALILYYIVLLPFSDSAGYSITATIRLIEGYLLFALFFTISSEPFGKLRVSSIELFTKGLIVVGAIAIFASWVFIAFPALAGFLPLMNLLYANYGHNHLADLLLPIFPLVIVQIQHKPSKLSWFLFVFYVVGIIFTFARGAWILLILYLLYVFLRDKRRHLSSFKISLVIASVVFTIFLTGISLYSLRFSPDATRLSGWFFHQLVKPSLTDDGRLKYWKQAVLAVRERPWFGSGPGTFYLQSKRLQEAPASFSWFSHSFPLQSLVELGVVGSALLFVLLVISVNAIVRNILLKKSDLGVHHWKKALLVSIGLIFIYSIYEFNLDFLIVWNLFWVLFGVSLGQQVENKKWYFPGFLKQFTSGVLILLVLFYTLSLVSSIFSASEKPEMAFLVAPYRVDILTQFQSSSILSKKQLYPISDYLIRIFYKHDPAAHEGIADYYMSASLFDDANLHLQEALRYDGNNIEIHRKYLESIRKKTDAIALRNEVRLLSQTFLSRDFMSMVYGIEFSIPEVWFQLPEDLFSTTSTKDHVRLFLAKMYYLYGFASLEKNPKFTESLWILARDLNPTLSYYHVELASLAIHTYHNKSKGYKYLEHCQLYIQAREHCARLLNNNFFLAPHDYLPGFLEKNIREFPIE